MLTEHDALVEQRDAVRRAERKAAFGSKVDFHCPYDEMQLRKSLEHPGFDICPTCWTLFEQADDAPAFKPGVFAAEWGLISAILVITALVSYGMISQ